MAAAVSAAVTAECSDGLPVVADEDCGSGTALCQLGQRDSPLVWHRLAVTPDHDRHVNQVPGRGRDSFAALPADVRTAVPSRRELRVALPEQCQHFTKRLQSAACQHDAVHRLAANDERTSSHIATTPSSDSLTFSISSLLRRYPACRALRVRRRTCFALLLLMKFLLGALPTFQSCRRSAQRFQ